MDFLDPAVILGENYMHFINLLFSGTGGKIFSATMLGLGLWLILKRKHLALGLPLVFIAAGVFIVVLAKGGV